MTTRIAILRIVVEEPDPKGAAIRSIEDLNEGLAFNIAQHLMETFNDDDSIKEIAIVRCDWLVEKILT